MNMQQMKSIANKEGMPFTNDVRASAARAYIESLHSKSNSDQGACGAALNKSIRKFGKP